MRFSLSRKLLLRDRSRSPQGQSSGQSERADSAIGTQIARRRISGCLHSHRHFPGILYSWKGEIEMWDSGGQALRRPYESGIRSRTGKSAGIGRSLGDSSILSGVGRYCLNAHGLLPASHSFDSFATTDWLTRQKIPLKYKSSNDLGAHGCMCATLNLWRPQLTDYARTNLRVVDKLLSILVRDLPKKLTYYSYKYLNSY